MPKKKRAMPAQVRKYLREQLREVAAEGGRKRWEKLTPEERRELARRGGLKSAQVRAEKKKKKDKQ